MAASLFDVEDLHQMPRVRDMTVGHVSTSDVDEFCQRYHYTATGGTTNWRYGLWSGPHLLGVVAYNLPTRTVCESVFGPEHGPDHVWHMGRLVMPDRVPRNAESRLIAGSLHAINRDHPQVWAVVTYAASDQGHIGYVYQASNALYTGTTGSSHYFVDSGGQRRSTFFDGWHVSLGRGESLGWTRHESSPKHRYVYVLGNRRERRHRLDLLKWPVLPYPKAA